MDIEAAYEKRWENIAMGLPRVEGNASYSNFLERPATLMPKSAFDQTENIININKKYFDLQLMKEYTKPEGEFIEMKFGTDQTLRAGVVVSQLIFDGSYIVGLMSSEVYIQTFKNIKKKTEIEIKAVIANSYAGVLISEENLLILNKNKEIAQNNVEESEKMLKNGFLEKQDLDQMRLVLSNINSQIRYAQRQVEVSYNMLKFNMGMPIEEDLSLSEDIYKITDLPFPLELFSKENDYDHTSNNIDIEISENTIRANKLLMNLEQMKYLPSIQASYSYDLTANNNDFKFFSSDQKWLGSSFIGISMKIPIFNSFKTSSLVQQARIAFDKSKNQHEELKEKLKLDFENTKSEYLLSVDQSNISLENVKLAEEILKNEQTKFLNGLSSSMSFSKVQNQMYDAQREYLQSLYKLFQSKTELNKILNL
ncbi:outer membrane efflux protein precursor [Ichthyobacterium seriolicida]|uniref:Outer membrane efflux protein n=2 Tax=Ichthyobacterium seriolicida TaxID=242600 RepID=A0A1J1EBA3_9FLAO|nr:outer membrane efflux protein precursor [Ichthyobacterium seriolicida]